MLIGMYLKVGKLPEIKVIILLTDGTIKEIFAIDTEIAAKFDIKCLGIPSGTNGMAPYPYPVSIRYRYIMPVK